MNEVMVLLYHYIHDKVLTQFQALISSLQQVLWQQLPRTITVSNTWIHFTTAPTFISNGVSELDPTTMDMRGIGSPSGLFPWAALAVPS